MNKKQHIMIGVMSTVGFFGCAIGMAFTGIMAGVAFGEAFKKEDK
jgi:tetrahydromethanopterin S-methyltransferase subunit F